MEQSKSPAISIIQKAIAAMGGNSWASVGASTMESTITYFNNSPVKATRSDDWSTGVNLHRLDTGNSTKPLTAIDLSTRRVLTRNSQAAMVVPANYDLVSLAEAYPAVALGIGLSRNCYFRVISESNHFSQERIGAVTMDCIASSYPKQTAHFTWWFDRAGLPTKVEVPILSMDGGIELYHTLQFLRYQQVNGLTVPAEMQMLIDGRLIKTESISKITISPSIPRATFDSPLQ